MIQISEHFNYAKLIRYALPTIFMFIFIAFYGVVDGFFISNYVGKTAFAAVNFIWPVLMILSSFGIMFGTGCGALCAKTIGEGDRDKANNTFSLIVYVSAIAGVILVGIGALVLSPLASFLGAEGTMLDDVLLYGMIYLLGTPACILQYAFQCLFATAEKPMLGFYITVAAGLTNIVLDALFICGFGWGVAGAAAASVMGQIMGGVIPLFYFVRKNTSLLQLKKAVFDAGALIKTCTNGSSELLNNISASIVGMLYNAQLLIYAGEDGVAAFGVLMYLNFVFTSIYLGFCVGISPIVSYNYGARNHAELQNLLSKCIKVIAGLSIVMFIASEALAKPLSVLFVGYDAGLCEMTLRGFLIFGFSFFVSGYPYFGSSFFTALNDGLTSASISFIRIMVFQVGAILIMPLIWGLDGIWASMIVSEGLAALMAFGFLIGKRKKYRY